jgi:threonine/homoserine/homoserine lactone efflux protein
MNLVDFIATVVVVTASGALAPGPLSFGVLLHGSKGGALAGFSCAIGHTLVEFPLVLALALGLLAATSQPFIKSVIGVAGGIGLIVFGILQIRDTISTGPTVNQSTRTTLPTGALVLGAALTGLNPYFILWWLTIGSVLIIQALAFTALLGVLVMYVSHVWMDYAFMTALAHFGKKGEAIVGSKYYRIVLAIFGVILIYYGASFIFGAI